MFRSSWSRLLCLSAALSACSGGSDADSGHGASSGAPNGGSSNGGNSGAPSAGSAHGGVANAGSSPGGGSSAGLPSSGGSLSGGSAGMNTAGAGGMGASSGVAGASNGGNAGVPGGGAGAVNGGAAGTCNAPKAGSTGKNPLFSDQYTADPAPFVDKCTFYITCGHDEGNTGFVMKEWFLLSSTDMVTWTKKVALSLKDFKWADANAWAGQMASKNGKYYWYVPVNEAGSGMAIGVAVADSPNGPFKDALGKAMIDDAFEISNMGFKTPPDTPYTIDPTVFVDDDGQAYLHYGSFGRMVGAKLNDDMITINGKMKEITPQGFFEAAFLTKRNGVYYEIYAAGVNPATIDYSTSTSPLGPWKYGGRILDALPNVPGQDAATSHPGVAVMGGQWYIVYHLSNGPNGGGTYKREVAVDKLAFNADGSIQKVVRTSGLSF